MSLTETPLSADAFGDVLRDWRRRRRLSQLDLGLEAEVSARHLSFLETGRAKPSRVMVDRLADGLDMPLDARNALLVAAGYAPRYRAGRWEDEALAPARQAFERMMAGHAPYPAILFDRHWTALDANAAGWLLLGGPGEGINLIERLIEDEAVRAQVLNWAEVGPFMRARLRAESRHAGGDAVLEDFADRLTALIGPETAMEAPPARSAFIPVDFDLGGAVLSLFSTVAELTSPHDVALADLRLELFFPSDEASRVILEGLGG